MIRKMRAKIIFTTIIACTLLLSSIGSVTSQTNEPLNSITESNDSIYPTDEEQPAISLDMLVCKAGDFQSVYSNNWAHEIRVFVGENVRFRIIVKNIVDYDLVDIQIANTLPPSDELSLIESTIITNIPSTHELANNQIKILFDEILSSEEVTIEYEMIALKETSVQGAVNSVTSTSFIHPKYLAEINDKKIILEEKINELEVIAQQISQKQMAYDGSIVEIKKLEDQITSTAEQINLLERQLTTLNEQFEAYNLELTNINAEINAINENINLISQEINAITIQIENQELITQSLQKYIDEKTQLIQTKQQSLDDINTEIESILEGSQSDQAYIQSLIYQQSSLESEILTISQQIQIAQDELDAEQSNLDATVALYNQILTEVDVLNQDIALNIQSIQNTQVQYQNVLELIDTTQIELDLEAQNLKNIQSAISQNNILLNQNIAETSALANQEANLQTNLQATVQQIYEESINLQNLQFQYDTTLADFQTTEVNLANQLVNLQNIQDNISTDTQNFNQLTTETNDVINQVANLQTILESTIQEIDAETINLQNLQTLYTDACRQSQITSDSIALENNNLQSIQNSILLNNKLLNQYLSEEALYLSQQTTYNQQLQSTALLIDVNEQNILQLEGQLLAVTTELDALINDNNLAQVQYTNVVNEIDTQTAILADYKNQLTILQTDLLNEQATLDNLQAQLQTELDDQSLNNQQTTDQQNLINQQNLKIANIKAEIASTQNTIAATQNTIDQLRIQQTQYNKAKLLTQTEIDLKSQQVSQLTAQISNYESDILNAEQILSDAQFQLPDVELQISNQEDLYAANAVLIAGYQTDLLNEQATLDNLQAQLQTELDDQSLNNQQTTDQQNLINQQNLKIANIKAEIASTQNTIAATQNTIDQLRIQQTQYNKAKLLTQTEIDLKNQENDNLALNLINVNNDIFIAEQDLIKNQQNYDNVDIEIVAVLGVISDLDTEILAEQAVIDANNVDLNLRLSEVIILEDKKTLETQDLNNLQNNLDSLYTNPEGNEDEIHRLEIEISNKVAIISDLTLQIDGEETIITNILLDNEKHSLIKSSLEDEKAMYTADLAVKEQDKLTYEQNIQDLSVSLTSLKEYETTIEADITAVENTIISLNEDLSTLQQNQIDTQTELSDEQATLQLENDNLLILQQSLSDEQLVLDGLNAQLTNLINQLASNNDAIQAILTSISNSESIIDSLSVQIIAKNDENSDIQAYLDQLAVQRAALSSEINLQTQLILLLTDQKDQTTLQLGNLQTEIAELNLQNDLDSASLQQVNDDLAYYQGLLQSDMDLLASKQLSLQDEKNILAQYIADYNQLVQDSSGDNLLINSLVDQIADQELTIQQIQDDISVKEADIRLTNDVISSLNVDKSILASTISGNGLQIGILSPQVDQLSSQISLTKADLALFYDDKAIYEAELVNIQLLIDENRLNQDSVNNILLQLSIQEQTSINNLAALQNQKLDYDAQKLQYESDILASQTTISDSNNRRLSYENDILAKTNLIDTNQQTILTLQQKIDQQTLDETNLQTTVADLENLKNTLTDLKIQLDTQIADKEYAISLLNEQQATTEADIASIQSQIADNQLAQSNLNYDINQLTDQELASQNQIITLQSNINNYNVKKTQYEEDIQNLEDQKVVLSIQYADKIEERDLLAVQIDNANLVITDKTAYISDKQVTLATLEDQLTAVSAELEKAILNSNNDQEYLQSLLEQKSKLENEIIINSKILQSVKDEFVLESNNLDEFILLKDSKIVSKSEMIADLEQKQLLQTSIDTNINNLATEIETAENKQLALTQQINDLSLALQNNVDISEQTLTLINQLQNSYSSVEQEIQLLSSEIELSENMISNIHMLNYGSALVHIENPEVSEASLSIEKQVNNLLTAQWTDETTINLGEKARFKITVLNNGKENMTDIQVTDILPENIVEYTGNAIPREPNYSNGVINWKIPSLAVEESYIIEYDVTGSNVGTGINTANVSVGFSDAVYNNPITIYDEDQAIINVIETSPNHPPIANDDYFFVMQDSTDNILDVLANDTDEDAEEKITILDVNQPNNGEITFDDQYVSYTPERDYFGPDEFSYTITDNFGETSTANVYISVVKGNSAPVANNDYYVISEDSSNNVFNVLENDSDYDSADALTILSIDASQINGDASIDGDTIIFTPASDYFGFGTLTYQINDGRGGEDTATVYITVENINDEPVAVEDNAITAENTSVDIGALENDNDIDGDVLTIADILTNPTNGDAEVLSDVIRYTPDNSFIGTDSFEYEISDGNGGSSTAVVNIEVYEVYINTPPNAEDDEISVYENSTDNVIEVLENDNDADAGDLLSINKIETNPENGTAEIQGDNIIYTPTPGFDGIDSFVYNITDNMGGYDTATVTITVDPTPPSMIVKPIKGYLYLWDNKIMKVNNLLNFLECRAMIIGPITLDIEVNETIISNVERVEYYLNNQSIWNTTQSPHLYILNELAFGINTIKIVAYGDGHSFTEEFDVFIINFGVTKNDNDADASSE